jgi:hypothetical protein
MRLLGERLAREEGAVGISRLVVLALRSVELRERRETPFVREVR